MEYTLDVEQVLSDKAAFARVFDHTILKADATPAQVEALCREAAEYGFYSVCVNSSYAALVSKLLAGTGVATCCVVGFPLGAMSAAAKARETEEAVGNGAGEIDMVVHLGMLKYGWPEAVREDIAAVVGAAKPAIVKVIIETCYLSDEEKINACRLAQEAGAHYVKTSTGFGTGGATEADIRLMRRCVGPSMGVKASGGIRDYGQAVAMLRAGASRIGASATVAIMKEYEQRVG